MLPLDGCCGWLSQAQVPQQQQGEGFQEFTLPRPIHDRGIRSAVEQIPRAKTAVPSAVLLIPSLATQTNGNQLGHRQLHKWTTTAEPLRANG